MRRLPEEPAVTPGAFKLEPSLWEKCGAFKGCSRRPASPWLSALLLLWKAEGSAQGRPAPHVSAPNSGKRPAVFLFSLISLSEEAPNTRRLPQRTPNRLRSCKKDHTTLWQPGQGQEAPGCHQLSWSAGGKGRPAASDRPGLQSQGPGGGGGQQED